MKISFLFIVHIYRGTAWLSMPSLCKMMESLSLNMAVTMLKERECGESCTDLIF